MGLTHRYRRGLHPGQAPNQTLLDPAHPLAQGIMGWWVAHPALFAAPLWVDAGPFHADGTIGNLKANDPFSGWRPATRPGGLGELYNPAAGYVDCGRQNINGGTIAALTGLTVTAWVFCTDLSAAPRGVVSRGLFDSGSNSSFFFYLDNASTDYHFTVFAPGTSFGVAVHGGHVTLNQWHRVVATWQAGLVMVIYVDGAQVASVTASVPSALQVGASSLVRLVLASIQDSTSLAADPFNGALDDIRLYNRALTPQEVAQDYMLGLTHVPGMRTVLTTPVRSPSVIVTPSRAKWQTASAAVGGVIVDGKPSKALWQTPAQLITRPLISGVNARWQTASATIPRTIRTSAAQALWRTTSATGTVALRAKPPGQARWQTVSARVTRQIVLPSAPTSALSTVSGVSMPPVCAISFPGFGPFPSSIITFTDGTFSTPRHFDKVALDILGQDFTAGNWGVYAPDIGLRLAYDPFQTTDVWEARIANIGDIEMNVEPGGGVATVANVNIDVIETGSGQSLLEIWQSVSSVAGVRILIGFALVATTAPVILFNGRIDTLLVENAMTRLTAVDDTLHQNLMLPQQIIATSHFPSAASAVIGLAYPIVYGYGCRAVAAPLLLVDIPNNGYLMAGHPAHPTSQIAVLSREANIWMAADTSATVYGNFVTNDGQLSGLAGLKLSMPPQEIHFNVTSYIMAVTGSTSFVSQASNVVDGDSSTSATIYPSGLDSTGAGLGTLRIVAVSAASQRGNNTFVIRMDRHHRAAGSPVTTTGTFTLGTVNASTGSQLRNHLYDSEHFRHILTALNTTRTVTAANMGASEAPDIDIRAWNDGGTLASAIADASGTSASGTIASVAAYEVGEVRLESFYQTPGDTEIVDYHCWWGREDFDATVTGVLSAVIVRPDHVMKSILTQELNVPINSALFAYAGNYYAAAQTGFDGGIGGGWSLERAPARQVLDDMARQAAAILAPTYDGTWGLVPYNPGGTPVKMAFTTANILTEDGSLGSLPKDRRSTFQVTLGTLKDVHSRFEVHYRYNVGTKKYDNVWWVDHTGTNLDGADALVTVCQQARTRYGKLEALVVEAYWIADDWTAQVLLYHLVGYFGDQRMYCEWDAPIQAIQVALGDFVTLDHPMLPANKRAGALFEVHTVRYQPTKARVHLRASTGRAQILPAQGMLSICSCVPSAINAKPFVASALSAYLNFPGTLAGVLYEPARRAIMDLAFSGYSLTVAWVMSDRVSSLTSQTALTLAMDRGYPGVRVGIQNSGLPHVAANVGRLSWAAGIYNTCGADPPAPEYSATLASGTSTLSAGPLEIHCMTVDWNTPGVYVAGMVASADMASNKMQRTFNTFSCTDGTVDPHSGFFHRYYGTQPWSLQPPAIGAMLELAVPTVEDSLRARLYEMLLVVDIGPSGPQYQIGAFSTVFSFYSQSVGRTASQVVTDIHTPILDVFSALYGPSANSLASFTPPPNTIFLWYRAHSSFCDLNGPLSYVNAWHPYQWYVPALPNSNVSFISYGNGDPLYGSPVQFVSFPVPPVLASSLQRLDPSTLP